VQTFQSDCSNDKLPDAIPTSLRHRDIGLAFIVVVVVVSFAQLYVSDVRNCLAEQETEAVIGPPVACLHARQHTDREVDWLDDLYDRYIGKAGRAECIEYEQRQRRSCWPGLLHTGAKLAADVIVAPITQLFDAITGVLVNGLKQQSIFIQIPATITLCICVVNSVVIVKACLCQPRRRKTKTKV